MQRPKSINIDNNSLMTIMGNSKIAMVYGFGTCLYHHIRDEIDMTPELSGYCHSDLLALLEIDDIEYAEQMDVLQRCKAGIIFLIMLNAHRIKYHLPIIPLIFCTERNVDNVKCQININQILQIVKDEYTHYTDCEIRLCYKIISEMDDDIRKTAEQTFKFICVNLTDDATRLPESDQKSIFLDAIDPPWKDAQWEQGWKARTNHKVKSNKAKKYHWRDIIKLREKFTFFDPASKQLEVRLCEFNKSVR